MRRWLRPLAAFSLIAIAAIGVVERAALHAHPLDENDLVPHDLMFVDAASRGDGERVAAAEHGDHPVCVECALAASAIAIAPSLAVVVRTAPPARVGPAESAGVGELRRERSAPARAPPSV